MPQEKAFKIRLFPRFSGESDENCQTLMTKSGKVTRFFSNSDTARDGSTHGGAFSAVTLDPAGGRHVAVVRNLVDLANPGNWCVGAQIWLDRDPVPVHRTAPGTESNLDAS